MIITISGTPGSGKSTIAKLLVEKLPAVRIYVGGIRRELARKKGMTLEELNEYAKTHAETDVDVDQEVTKKARELAKKEKVVIVEGYPQYHFLPESFKIFITVDFKEAARRIWQDLQNPETREARNEGKFTSLKQLEQYVLERINNDQGRYKKYYSIDYLDQSQYDLVLDTTNLTPQQAVKKILEAWGKFSLSSSHYNYKK